MRLRAQAQKQKFIMKKIHHLLLLIFTLLLVIGAAVGMFFVHVNSDMTKYLPADSQMSRGLQVMATEFGEADISMPSISLMCGALSEEEKTAFRDTLTALPDVNKATVQTSEDGAHTLYQLYVDESVDQKALGKQIRKAHPQVQLVETAQDGATPPVSVMIIAAFLIVAVLLFMAQSWVEPFIYLGTTGMAILLNMGTNAFLPSVSITTHSIAAILQMVLSIDYCIILTNRYRQKKKSHPNPIEAVNFAIKSAYRPVISSAMTTVVGLLMLCFMRLRIGMDMGVVLAKGVICSLICTFSVLPSFLILLDKAIEKSHKKTFVIPTERLGRFATSHKIPIAISSVILFAIAFFFSQRTSIFFSAEAESRIEEVFPQPNAFVIIYNTADEDSIAPMIDQLAGDTSVNTVISYPTLLQRPYSAAEMAVSLKTMSAQFGDMINLGNGDLIQEMLTPELVQVLYYMQSGLGDTLTIDFPTLTRFIDSDCLNNPLFAGFIDDSMRDQMALLRELTSEEPVEDAAIAANDNVNDNDNDNLNDNDNAAIAAAADANAAADAIAADADAAAVSFAESAEPTDRVATPLTTIAIDSSDNPNLQAPTIVPEPMYAVVDFINRLYIDRPSALTMDFRTLADTITLRRVMDAAEMSAFIGSSLTQTRLVFNYDKQHRKAMTPLEYMHILTDDLFFRKALNGMITPEQKEIVRMRTGIMDLANKNTYLSAQQLVGISERFGIMNITGSYVDSLMEPIVIQQNLLSLQERLIANAESSSESVSNSDSVSGNSSSSDSSDSVSGDCSSDSGDSIYLVEKALPEVQQPMPAIATPAKHKPTREEIEADRKAELFLELMYGGKRYPADRMAQYFAQLGQEVDANMISLLYTYYGSQRLYNDSLQMSIEEVLSYVSGPLLTDPRMASLIPDSVADIISGVEQQMQSGVGMLRGNDHSLCVVLTDYPAESDATYAFVDTLERLEKRYLPSGSNMIGESVMYSEMKNGFSHEMMIVTILTILAIFLIVAITFRSVIVPAILILTVMTAVYVNVVCCGIISGEMLYLAYLIVQSILMGATIDYGILFANYYREKRRTLPARESVFESYKGSIRTIMTSGLIMVVAPAAMALLTDNVMIRNIVGAIAIGAFVAIILILVLLPGVLMVFDRWVVHNAVPKHGEPITDESIQDAK